jgi:hypothetical protein
MTRPDWRKPGTSVCRYATFCPINLTTEKRRPAKAKQTPGVSPISPTGVTADEKSALAHQYDMELHQMVAYMRRLDGALPPNAKGQKVMDPFAPDGDSKWCTGTTTPLFGFWAYYAWEHVLSGLLSSAFGTIFKVTNQRTLKALLGAQVMMYAAFQHI